MFSLPSVWNLVISTVVFFVAAWYLKRCCYDYELPRGMTRSLLIFIVASFMSWGSGVVVDWVQDAISEPKQEIKQTDEVKDLLQSLNPKSNTTE